MYSRYIISAGALALALIFLSGCTPKEEPKTAEVPTTETSVDTPAPASDVAAPVNTPAPRMREMEAVKLALVSLSPEQKLGARLYFDNRIGNPGANLATSCRTCHVPVEAGDGSRMWADNLAFSVIPANDRGSKLETLRNTPSLLDATTEKSFPSDGQYDSLSAYLHYKVLSEFMGWRPGEEDQAKREIQALLMNDDGTDPLAIGAYAEQFQAVKNIDVLAFSPDDALDAVVASIIDYLGTVTTRKTAPYDAMAYLNRIPEGLEPGTPQRLSSMIFGSIGVTEEHALVKFPAGYDENAYQGLKTFMRVMPTKNHLTGSKETNIGNCIACHVPPRFTDGKFHNIGVTQFEYDAAHGDGAFMNYTPTAPSDKTRARVNKADLDKADLGRWNIDPTEENIGAVKTPKLRDPKGTNPYLHDGSAASIEDAIRAHLRAADLARAGQLRNPDPELLKITGITDKDVAQLVAFMETLNEVSPEEFHDIRISNVRLILDGSGRAVHMRAEPDKP